MLSVSILKVFINDFFVDFLAVYRHILRRVDPYSYLVTLDAQNGNLYLVPDIEGFTRTSCQYKHSIVSLIIIIGLTGLREKLFPPYKR